MKGLIVPTAVKVAFMVVIVGFGAAYAHAGKECSVDRECGEEEFCDTTPRCPGKGIIGQCKTKPLACTMDYNPVTACDGKVYSNACMAASNGKSIETEEERAKRHHHREHRERVE